MRTLVYILSSLTVDKYYVGQSEDVLHRLRLHNGGHVKSTAPYKPWKLVWLEYKDTRGEAMILERKLKNLSKLRLNSFMIKYAEGIENAKNFEE